MTAHGRSWPVKVALLLTLAGVAISGCVPAARTDVPREARGPEVHAQRQKAISVADAALSQLTASAPVEAGIDGCTDVRGERSGYLWRCQVIRASIVVGSEPPEALERLRARLHASGCTAYPGLATTAQRYRDGIPSAALYPVTYRCSSGVLVTIAFSTPNDPGLNVKTDLGAITDGPGRQHVINEQPWSAEVLRDRRAGPASDLLMIISVHKFYWAQPRG